MCAWAVGGKVVERRWHTSATRPSLPRVQAKPRFALPEEGTEFLATNARSTEGGHWGQGRRIWALENWRHTFFLSNFFPFLYRFNFLLFLFLYFQTLLAMTGGRLRLDDSGFPIRRSGKKLISNGRPPGERQAQPEPSQGGEANGLEVLSAQVRVYLKSTDKDRTTTACSAARRTIVVLTRRDHLFKHCYKWKDQ